VACGSPAKTFVPVEFPVAAVEFPVAAVEFPVVVFVATFFLNADIDTIEIIYFNSYFFLYLLFLFFFIFYFFIFLYFYLLIF
jgi:hypothetical protein